jgi:uncharacterized protein
MGRFFILVILVLAAVWLVKRALRAPQKSDGARNPPPLQGDLVSCARCGLNLPRSEASESAGAFFCGPEHAKLGTGKG